MTAFDAVLLYILWMIVLLAIYDGPRIPLVLMGSRRLNSWERDKTPADAAFFQRAKAAHLNCIENLPLFAGVVLVAALMEQIAIVDHLGAYVLYARVGQSVMHLCGASTFWISLRATFFTIQIALIVYMAVMLLMA